MKPVPSSGSYVPLHVWTMKLIMDVNLVSYPRLLEVFGVLGQVVDSPHGRERSGLMPCDDKAYYVTEDLPVAQFVAAFVFHLHQPVHQVIVRRIPLSGSFLLQLGVEDHLELLPALLHCEFRRIFSWSYNLTRYQIRHSIAVRLQSPAESSSGKIEGLCLYSLD